MQRLRTLALLLLAPAVAASFGCAGVKTFPAAARSGDTVILPVGSFDGMDLTNTTLTLDAEGDPADPTDDVVGLDLAPNVRGIFNVYPDPTSAAANYDNTLSVVPGVWHRPAWQTLMVVDLDPSLPPGQATLHVSSSAENSSGIDPVDLALEILPGTGAADPLSYLWGQPIALNLNRLAPKPHVDVWFEEYTTLGAAEIVLALDDPAIDPATINVVPRRLHAGTGTFELMQAAYYWHVDPDRLVVRMMAPQGLNANRVAFSVVYQSTTGTPAFHLDTAATRFWDVDGVAIAATPNLTAHP